MASGMAPKRELRPAFEPISEPETPTRAPDLKRKLGQRAQHQEIHSTLNNTRLLQRPSYPKRNANLCYIKKSTLRLFNRLYHNTIQYNLSQKARSVYILNRRPHFRVVPPLRALHLIYQRSRR